MKILTGIADPGGEIWLEGSRVVVGGVNHARELGLSIIHQELNMVPDLTVAQNLYLGRQGSHRAGWINDAKLNREAAQLFERLGMNLDPAARIGDLSVARQQMVEIARALSYNSRILVMDEPAAALTVGETETLFGMIRDFITPDTGLICISHRMPELEEITDRVSVLRDGQYIGTVTTKEVEMCEAISLMVGREVSSDARPRTEVTSDEVVLKVEGLATRKLLRDISFEIREGEFLGFAGLMGPGARRWPAASSVLIRAPRAIWIRGKKAAINTAADAVRNGIGYLSEDRKQFGLLLEQNIRQNAAMAAMKDLDIGGFTLDGRILIFDEPTRGIDVGAKEETYELLEQLCGQGKAILMISSELPEALRMNHRIAVVTHGRITGFLDDEEAIRENIMELAIVGKAQLKGNAA